MWFLSDFYKSTDFGQPVRSSEAHRVRGLHHRHDACYAVFSSVSTQDGGKHNAIPKTGMQVVVADPYDEWDREEKANQKESPRRNEAPTTDNNSVRLQVRNTGHQQTTCKCQY